MSISREEFDDIQIGDHIVLNDRGYKEEYNMIEICVDRFNYDLRDLPRVASNDTPGYAWSYLHIDKIIKKNDSKFCVADDDSLYNMLGGCSYGD